MVLNEDWNLVLRHRECDLARFDPSEYTLSKIMDEVEGILKIIPSSPESVSDLVDTL